MKNNIKHSKYKNTGILFELLIRQVTSDMMSNKDSKAIKIVKKYFTNTELGKEYELYNTIINAPKLTEGKAETLINAVIDQFKKLNRNKLSNEKYNLIKEIKRYYDVDNFFKAKISNYKLSASIYTLFESTHQKGVSNTNQIITNKINILEHITKENVNSSKSTELVVEEFTKEDKEIRILAYKILIEKFNKKYESLSDKQKKILKEYINNITDTKNLKRFLNEKLESVKMDIIRLSDTIDNKVVKIKLNEIISLMHPISENQSIKDDHLVSLMHYYELVEELKKIK